jgi:integrase
VLPLTAEEIRAVEQAAVTPAQRLTIALAAVHAARPKAICELTTDNIDLPSRRITIAGHRQRLGELTHDALLAWLRYRRATWPDTANRHVLVSRISALGTGPVSHDYVDKHQPRGISLERIRRDRILQEALATGADPLHLTLVFNIDHTNAIAYANAARSLLNSPAERALSHAARNRHQPDDGRYGR